MHACLFFRIVDLKIMGGKLVQFFLQDFPVFKHSLHMHNVTSGISDFMYSRNKCMNAMHWTGLTFV